MDYINVIGAGLAGCEAAHAASKLGVKVKLYDIKPYAFTPAHSNKGFAELVCSNSLKNKDILSAAGLLKQEMGQLNSLLVEAAKHSGVPAGGALAVDREKFSRFVTEHILQDNNITFISEEIDRLPEGITVVATGPLTTDKLSAHIAGITGADRLYFYDAAAPIISGDSIDYAKAYFMDRYNKGSGDGDYLNCPMDKDEYLQFYHELINAKRAPLKSFEEQKVFEGCMPVEVMGGRGVDTLRYGPLKPVGLAKAGQGERPYAVVQLRKENIAGQYFNMVGFQTNLTFSEQKRVFSMIPALKNADFIKYGVMHRNTYINAPQLLNGFYELKQKPGVFFAGQISGVEGYMESAASGIMCGINAARLFLGKSMVTLASDTMIGALINYITTANANFQPMSANYAIISPSEQRFSDKKQRNMYYADRSFEQVQALKNQIFSF